MVDVKTTCPYDSIGLDQFAHGMKMKMMASFLKKNYLDPILGAMFFWVQIFTLL